MAALKAAINRAMAAGNGRTARCDTEQELAERLDADGVDFDPADIPTALAQLEEEEEEDLIRYGPRPQPTAFNQHPERPSVQHTPRPYLKTPA
jgi:hypothetical protein